MAPKSAQKVFNPKTGRYVLASGRVGQMLQRKGREDEDSDDGSTEFEDDESSGGADTSGGETSDVEESGMEDSASDDESDDSDVMSSQPPRGRGRGRGRGAARGDGRGGTRGGRAEGGGNGRTEGRGGRAGGRAGGATAPTGNRADERGNHRTMDNRAGRASVGRASVGRASVGRASVGRASVGRAGAAYRGYDDDDEDDANFSDTEEFEPSLRHRASDDNTSKRVAKQQQQLVGESEVSARKSRGKAEGRYASRPSELSARRASDGNPELKHIKLQGKILPVKSQLHDEEDDMSWPGSRRQFSARGLTSRK